MELASRDTLHVVLLETAKHDNSYANYLWFGLACVVLLMLYFKNNPFRRIVKESLPKKYNFNLGVVGFEGEIEYTSLDQEVAWKIYVELITRVSANELKPGTGILREALNSLYKAFGELRSILKDSGARLAVQPKPGKESVATLLIKIMNKQMRPFLSKWHPLLEQHEAKKTKEESIADHESKWGENQVMRDDLSGLQKVLDSYINALKEIAEG